MTHKEPISQPRPAPADRPAAGAVAPTDEDLLKQYVERRDEEAFALLVQRFGPLVFSVCQRALGHQQDAEDAFQATFLVLARKAGTIANAQATAAFLCRVAYRIAKKLKRQKARRSMASIHSHDIPADEETPELIWRSLRPVLDEEVDRLPDKYRLPFVLHYLHGLSYEQAAHQLGCPVGTLGSWLAQARERLRRRLVQRGIALSSALLAAVLTGYAGSVPPPPSLTVVVSQQAHLFAAGNTLVVAVTPAALAAGYLRSWSRAGLARMAAWGLLVFLALALLLFGLHQWFTTGSSRGNEQSAAVQAQEDLDRLQGTWGFAGGELLIGGNPFPAGGTHLRFEGNICKIVAATGTEVPMTFTLNPTTNPKQIDLLISLPQPTPARGIYEVSGDELRICYTTTRGEPRPTKFESPRNTKVMLYDLRRGQP
jgi:RNA polymerase sigma factor (sigma-70 family)